MTKPISDRPWLSRRQVLPAFGGLLLAGLGLDAPAKEAGPVRVVVPFTPGTTPDICARLIGPSLQRRFGRTFVTDNRPGASGLIGMDAVAKAPPDGATLLSGTNTMLTLPFLYAKVPFDVIKSFTPIGMMGYINFALVVHPSVPATNVRELVAWVRAQPAPVDYASPGKGTFQHLTMEWITRLVDIKLTHVPYRGGGPALADVLGGHVKLLVMPMHTALQLAGEGKLRVLGGTRHQRDAAAPDLPSLHEQGVQGLDADAWYAMYGPQGMPADMVKELNGALNAALAEPEIKSTLAKQGFDVRPGTPESLAQISVTERDKWGALIKSLNIPME